MDIRQASFELIEKELDNINRVSSEMRIDEDNESLNIDDLDEIDNSVLGIKRELEKLSREMFPGNR